MGPVSMKNRRTSLCASYRIGDTYGSIVPSPVPDQRVPRLACHSVHQCQMRHVSELVLVLVARTRSMLPVTLNSASRPAPTLDTANTTTSTIPPAIAPGRRRPRSPIARYPTTTPMRTRAVDDYAATSPLP